MEEVAIKALQDRTTAKLRYAAVHLHELEDVPVNGDAFDRAHQESFLYHLVGVVDAFLAELNAYYECGLSAEAITPGKLRKRLIEQKKSSVESIELFRLANDRESWLSRAKRMRHLSTHVTGVGRTFHVGGEKDGEVWLNDPVISQQSGRHYVLEFKNWQGSMTELVERLRTSALKACKRSKIGGSL